ncbi:hypothetical protein [Pseudoflavonifractor phocaeensis]|uniref:hypothetical protein n=1 Tax=Pseudoflavonifractor phocaeensis TaxID=1870988 RepID=UPI00195B06C9|nr:hypothetical protein [Pseudoflavonifractor phocaeensis]MBM6723280.1 hypothetical protein [Pseudoflavonifractor phocaeensis]
MTQDLSAASVFASILVVLCTIAVWYIYHKLFDVIYFNFSKACCAELLGCFLVGAILAGLIIKFWYISILVIVALVIALGKKKQ